MKTMRRLQDSGRGGEKGTLYDPDTSEERTTSRRQARREEKSESTLSDSVWGSTHRKFRSSFVEICDAVMTARYRNWSVKPIRVAN